ncbi:MAG TPA: hypothetical protein EYP59_20160 [Thiotrichaceae bacterium]|nr:hypothetical protein [Thiotrichaceae bacterium]
MTKMTTSLPIMGSFCIGISLLFNPCVADEATPIPAETMPQSAEQQETVVPEKSSPNEEAETALKEDEPEEPSPNEVPEITLLKDTVGEYITAWQDEDFKTLRGFESWEGCLKGELNEVDYIQSFKDKSRFQKWQITKVINEQNNQYKVLILVSSDALPPRIAAIVGNKTIKSTLPQWWKKQGDRFVHLFHIERKNLLL